MNTHNTKKKCLVAYFCNILLKLKTQNTKLGVWYGYLFNFRKNCVLLSLEYFKIIYLIEEKKKTCQRVMWCKIIYFIEESIKREREREREREPSTCHVKLVLVGPMFIIIFTTMSPNNATWVLKTALKSSLNTFLKSLKVRSVI